MRLLVDAHSMIWAVEQPAKLSAAAAAALQDPSNELLLSSATIWEIAIKVGLGKLKLSLPYRQWMTKAMSDLNMSILPITVDYAQAQSNLPRHHGDPFDRMLVAQAK